MLHFKTTVLASLKLVRISVTARWGRLCGTDKLKQSLCSRQFDISRHFVGHLLPLTAIHPRHRQHMLRNAATVQLRITAGIKNSPRALSIKEKRWGVEITSPSAYCWLPFHTCYYLSASSLPKITYLNLIFWVIRYLRIGFHSFLGKTIPVYFLYSLSMETF